MSSPLERQEIVIMSLDFIVPNCIDTDFSSALPTLRRQDILSGIKLQLNPLLVTSYNCLYQSIIQYLLLITNDPAFNKDLVEIRSSNVS